MYPARRWDMHPKVTYHSHCNRFAPMARSSQSGPSASDFMSREMRETNPGGGFLWITSTFWDPRYTVHDCFRIIIGWSRECGACTLRLELSIFDRLVDCSDDDGTRIHLRAVDDVQYPWRNGLPAKRKKKQKERNVLYYRRDEHCQIMKCKS